MKEPRDILLISKDRNLRNAGVGMLEAAGHSVHTASSMRDALGVLSSEPIGLIVCGLELEDIHATDFLSYLKNDPLRETIPFVFYIHTQSQVDLSPKHAQDLGADDVIFYPLPAGEFIRRVGKHMHPANGPEGGELGKSDSIPESLPSRKEEARVDSQQAGAGERDVRLSFDGSRWSEGHIINHTFHGAMVETRLRGKQGSTVRLRYGQSDDMLTATGRLMHILLGDQERPMGMGINFREDPNWRRIHQKVKTASESGSGDTEAAAPEAPPSPVDTPQQDSSPVAEKNVPDRRITPEVPIGIEVSRDGALWMHGEINEYDGIGAAITTPVLGKSGETLHIRITSPGEQKVLKGRIERVTLDDLKMPAGMEISFPEKASWLSVTGGFTGGQLPGPATGSVPEKAPEVLEGEAARKAGWTDTLADGKESSKAKNIKDRFYKSLIGKKLGNYEIVSFLDAGSMGGVFKGWDIALERDVAIKVISYELSSREEFVEMFFKEARLVSKLNHPNIAHIYFIGNETGIVYYSMEFIHGSTLAEFVEQTDRIQSEKAVVYLADACRALDRVWQEKIIHRDIKPANIMISEHGTVKLLDFGVARQQKKGAVSAKGNIVGSPAYLSPETIREEPVDFRSDIYSLGATFYHVLCGSAPFTDDTLEGTLRKHLDTLPTPLKEKLPSVVPSIISDVIQKMLAKRPEDRFQSYQEIISALSSAAPADAPAF
jgi:DNA-binding response OmpR family regulator/predicted Ser/Thr protein kinase